MKRVQPIRLLASCCALLAAVLLGEASAAEDSAIVDTDYVVRAMARGAVIWDTRSAAAYREEHLPGAVNIDEVGAVLRDENTEDYIEQEKIEKLLGGAGIDPQKEIVVYGAKANPYVYFALLTLQYFNAANARVYHGGIDDWKSAGRATTMEVPKLEPVALKLKTKPELLVETAEVVRRLRDPMVQLLDVRTSKEYSGEDIRAIRGGHIPGAIPVHYMANWVDPDARSKIEKKQTTDTSGLNLKRPDALRALYSKLDPNKETIVYCQSGIRAAETATVLKDIGFRHVRVYDSSWLGYGNTLDAPADNVAFFNVGLLQSKLNAMQKRIDALDKELAQTKAEKATLR